ncbi:MAG: urate hydroxylase PuuD [Acidobacteria bacterium]|nr:urate hydroxylase PuuD [Acidobacteriota bacterium]
MDISVLHELALLQPKLVFPTGASEIEQIILRWVHLAAGITWIGLLYFFNLVNVPFMKELDAPSKGKVIPNLMPKALWWFRWAAVVTWLAGFRYMMILMKTDATNAGEAALFGKWMGIFFGVWIVAFVIIYGLFMMAQTALGNNGYVLGILVAVVTLAGSYAVLMWMWHPMASSRMLSIAIGGGIGTMMMLNVWGLIWRCQKKLIAWTKASAEEGKPMPPEAAKLQRLAFLVSRANFYLSFPMLFFMATASHFPFLAP